MEISFNFGYRRKQTTLKKKAQLFSESEACPRRADELSLLLGTILSLIFRILITTLIKLFNIWGGRNSEEQLV